MRPADRAWLALGAGVLAWDVFGSETLSAAMVRYRDRWPVIIPAGIVYLAAHLHGGVIPERFDPLHLMFGWRQLYQGRCSVNSGPTQDGIHERHRLHNLRLLRHPPRQGTGIVRQVGGWGILPR